MYFSFKTSGVFCPKADSFSVTPSFSVIVLSVSALHSQSHSLYRLASMHPNGLPVVFFPGNLPSMTFCNKESCLKTCPIQSFCLFLKVSRKERLSSTVRNICSFDARCVQGIHIIRRQIHISKASRIVFCLNVQVSLPYKPHSRPGL